MKRTFNCSLGKKKKSQGRILIGPAYKHVSTPGAYQGWGIMIYDELGHMTTSVFGGVVLLQEGKRVACEPGSHPN